MEYILNPHTPGIDYTRYSRYLEKVRAELPPHVYAFASDPRHFDLSSESSLHDAWLDSLTVRETASGARQEIRQMEVSLCLLGPSHDRRIHLHYTGVFRYFFDSPPREGAQHLRGVAHGDLVTHEIRSGQAGRVIHEILFEKGSTLLIECNDMRHSEEMLGSRD